MILEYSLSYEEAKTVRLGKEGLQSLQLSLQQWLLKKRDLPVTAWRILNFPIKEKELGATPLQLKKSFNREVRSAIQMLESIACSFGSCITFPGMKQEKDMIQQIFPVPGFENRQSAASSRSELLWHTEHADRKNLPDFLLIACLRNKDKISTYLSRPDLNKLDKVSHQTLSISEEFDFPTWNELTRSMPVIDSGCLRWDPVYCKPKSHLAQKAMQNLEDLIEESKEPAPQEPGSLLLIPNLWTVHARGSFHARYDGSDRWLMRAMIQT